MTKDGRSSFPYIKDWNYGNSYGTPEYIAYVISHLTNQKEKNKGCLDYAWEKSLELADKFINSKYDISNKSLWECIEDFLVDTLDKHKHI